MSQNSIEAGSDTKVESNTAGASGADSARDNLQTAALTLFQCKDGSLVNSPLDCQNTNYVPDLTIEGASNS